MVEAVFTIAAFRPGPSLYWNIDLYEFSVSPVCLLLHLIWLVPPAPCCPTISGLNDIPSGSMWDMISRWHHGMAGGEIQKFRGVTSLWVNPDQWEMGDRREPRSITWFGFIFGSCGQFILASHPGEDPHAKWICLLSNLPSLYGF